MGQEEASRDAQAGRRAAGAVLVGSLILGTSGVARSLLVPEASGPGVASWRLALGSLGMVLFVLWRREGADLMAVLRHPSVWFMGAAVAGAHASYFIATANAGVAVAVLIAIGLGPLLSGLFGWLAHEGAPGWLWVAMTGIAIVGLALIVGGSSTTANLVGILAAISTAVCQATFTVLGVRLARSGSSGSPVVTASFCIGALLLSPFLVTTSWVMSPQGVVLALWLGFGTVTVAYLLLGVGLRHLQPGHISTLQLMEPTTATILGVLILGESLGIAGLAGCACVLAALAVVGLSEGRRPKARHR